MLCLTYPNKNVHVTKTAPRDSLLSKNEFHFTAQSITKPVTKLVTK